MARLLGAQDIRRLAQTAGVTPSKKWGQNFVIDPNTVRRIVDDAHVTTADTVLEVGPGLGSLTLALLPEAGSVVCIEVDQRLAALLPDTVAQFAPELSERLTVVCADALTVRGEHGAVVGLENVGEGRRPRVAARAAVGVEGRLDRKSTRLNSSH